MIPPRVAHISPLLLYVYFALRAVFPWSERGPMWSAVLDVVTAPFAQVDFKEAYVGDILTSTVRVLVDLAFASAYCAWGLAGWFASSQRDGALHAWKRHDAFEAHALHLDVDPVGDAALFARVVVPSLTVSPLWWRFLQCLHRSYHERARWPHLGNAGKYACALTVSLWGLYHPELRASWGWIAAFVCATLYQFAWDLFMDWDVVRLPSARGGLPSLRARLLYGRRGYYLAAIVGNLVLRFAWTMTLIPEPERAGGGEGGGGERGYLADFQLKLSPFLAACEILRRSFWSFLRLENEHLHVYGTGHARELDDADAEREGSGDEAFAEDERLLKRAAPPAPRAAERLLKSRSGGGGGGGGAPADEGAFSPAHGAPAAAGARGAGADEKCPLSPCFPGVRNSTDDLSNGEVLWELGFITVVVATVIIIPIVY